MKPAYYPITSIFAAIICLSPAYSQVTQPVTGTPAPNYAFKFDPSPDPAMRHNRLLQERTGDGVYHQIGPYKVTGTPFLFGGKNKGNLFSAQAKAFNIYLSYNTYNQELEFYSTSNPDKPLMKEPGDVDSFMIHVDAELGITTPLKFVYGLHIGNKEKTYFLELYAGNKFSIYKKYKADLGYVSTNYIQPDLRQFDLHLEYFYIGGEKKMKKIKANAYTMIKEFKSVMDLTGIVTDDAFVLSADETFKKAFEHLNK